MRECSRMTSTIDKQFVDPAHDGYSINTQYLDVDLMAMTRSCMAKVGW